jgi:hypothetical protein
MLWIPSKNEHRLRRKNKFISFAQILLLCYLVTSMVRLPKSSHIKIRNFLCRYDSTMVLNAYTWLFSIPWHITKNLYTWKAQRKVTCDIPIEREPLEVYFAYLINALYVCPLWRSRRQADNPFPSLPDAASHDRFLRWQRWFVFAAQADPVAGALQRPSP